MWRAILVLIVAVVVTARHTANYRVLYCYTSTPDHLGNYHFRYATTDGNQYHQAEGYSRLSATGHRVNAVRGTVRWASPYGVQQGYRYISDEHGYRTKPLTDNGDPGITSGSANNTGCVKGRVLVNGECVIVYVGSDTIDDEGDDRVSPPAGGGAGFASTGCINGRKGVDGICEIEYKDNIGLNNTVDDQNSPGSNRGPRRNETSN